MTDTDDRPPEGAARGRWPLARGKVLPPPPMPPAQHGEVDEAAETGEAQSPRPPTREGATSRRREHQARARRTGEVRRPASPTQALEPKPAPAPLEEGWGSRRGSSRMGRERRGGFARFVYSILSVFVVLGVIAGVLFAFAWRSFDRPGPLDRQLVVDIRSGVGLATIAEQLKREGIIEDEYVFMAGVLLNNVKGSLKAGEFQIPAHASMRDVMETLVEGRALLYSVTIPEGWTSYEIIQKIAADQALEGEVGEVPPEGALLPETYHFPRGATKAEVVEQMRLAQEKLLEQLWATRAPDLPFSTIEEALTLASIVEKETGQAEERRVVASVFVNRLRRGMRLQSDPTIIYGITLGRGPLGRPLLQSDIDKVTPYNTYQVNGLPPTPIASPGRASIEATLNPADTDYLFFVADGTGGHVFAESLAEHTRNVARWRQIEREQAAAAAAAAAAAPATTGAGEEPATSGPIDTPPSAVIETETEELPLP